MEAHTKRVDGAGYCWKFAGNLHNQQESTRKSFNENMKLVHWFAHNTTYVRAIKRGYFASSVLQPTHAHKAAACEYRTIINIYYRNHLFGDLYNETTKGTGE